MNKILRNIVACVIVVIGSLFLAALITGEGNAVLPTSESVSTDCAQVRADSDEVAASTQVPEFVSTVGPVDQSDTDEGFAARGEARAEHRRQYGEHQKLVDKARYQVMVFLNIVDANPECFSPKDVAAARTTLANLARQ